MKSVVKVEEGPENCSMPKAGLKVVSKKTLPSVEVEEPKAVVSNILFSRCKSSRGGTLFSTTYERESSTGKWNVVELSVVFDVWGIIEAVGTAFGTVTESLEVEVLCLSTANQVLSKRP